MNHLILFVDDKNNINIQLDKLLDVKVGNKVCYVRDRVKKPGTLINLVLDSSRLQLLCTIKCADNEVF